MYMGIYLLPAYSSELSEYTYIYSGDHITFTCPLHQAARRALLGTGPHTWVTLDAPRYDPDDNGGDDDGDKTDLVMEFFTYLFTHLS